PTMAVLPSADNATEMPWKAGLTAPVPTNLAPCWLHTPPLRVNTHAAPALLLSRFPPTMAVSPSSDNATEAPCWAAPTAPVPTSLFPCWVHPPPLRMNTHAAPAPPLSLFPAHDGGVAVGGQRDREALLGGSNRAAADQ